MNCAKVNVETADMQLDILGATLLLNILASQKNLHLSESSGMVSEAFVLM